MFVAPPLPYARLRPFVCAWKDVELSEGDVEGRRRCFDVSLAYARDLAAAASADKLSEL